MAINPMQGLMGFNPYQQGGVFSQLPQAGMQVPPMGQTMSQLPQLQGQQLPFGGMQPGGIANWLQRMPWMQRLEDRFQNAPWMQKLQQFQQNMPQPPQFQPPQQSQNYNSIMSLFGQ